MFADSNKAKVKERSAVNSASTGTAAISAAINAPSGLQFKLTAAGLPPQTFAVVDFSLNEAFSSPLFYMLAWPVPILRWIFLRYWMKTRRCLSGAKVFYSAVLLA